jgi:hypothetical protein
MANLNLNPTADALHALREFSLLDAITGRRSRRFALGATLPDGPFAYQSTHEPLPLSDLEQLLLLATMTGNTGWNYLIPHHTTTPAHMPAYPAAAGGRAHAAAAGIHTSELFYTDDRGVYFFKTRDEPALVEPAADGSVDPETWLTAHQHCVHQLSDRRLHLPANAMDAHNTWCANVAGSTLFIPVADLAQHLIGVLCFMVQNGGCLYDNVHNERIPGIEQFRHLVDIDNPAPLTQLEQNSLVMVVAELTTASQNGMLLLQALGLGGWLYTGLDMYAVLGASGDPAVPGLGFHYTTAPRWPVPNVTGLSGVYEGYCPPHFPDMRAAVDAYVERQFGPGGPFNSQTPGPWRENARIRGAVPPHNDEFKACVALMAQFVYDRFGKFPATVPTIFAGPYLQAHHLDLDFYDTFFTPGAYLQSHADHLRRWHS